MTQDLDEQQGAGAFDPEKSGAPWIPVTLNEVAGLLAAYRRAQAEAERIRRSLTEQAQGQEMPTVTASVDSNGEPMVCIDLPNSREIPGDGGSGAAA